MSNDWHSGCNNIKIWDFFETIFPNLIGFTDKEIDKLIEECYPEGYNTQFHKDLKKYYNGYKVHIIDENNNQENKIKSKNFVEIYNTWSVLNAVYAKKINNYWL